MATWETHKDYRTGYRKDTMSVDVRSDLIMYAEAEEWKPGGWTWRVFKVDNNGWTTLQSGDAATQSEARKAAKAAFNAEYRKAK